MESQSYPQCRIVPIQMLKAENTEKFLDGLSYIAGIRRVLIHGPGYVAGGAENLCVPCNDSLPESSTITISEQPVNMHVLMGDVIVETVDDQVIERIADYCLEFFDDLAVQILVGKFIKTEASQSDFVKKGSMQDKDLIGLSDYKQTIDPFILRIDAEEQCNA